MARMFWLGVLGYPTVETRDEVLAAFTAAAADHAEHLTPATWDQVPDVPAGIGPTREVDGLPGFSFAYDVTPTAWVNNQEWSDLSEIAQGPSESGQQSLTTLL